MIQDLFKPLMEKKMPPRKRLYKKGTLDLDIVEATPVVWQGRLLRFEWIRPNCAGDGHGYYGADTESGYFRFVDMETGEVASSDFAFGRSYGCAYTEDGVMYAFGSERLDHAHALEVFWSRDLKNWESKEILRVPEEMDTFNSTVCKGKDGYYMMFELKMEKTPGTPWSTLFAFSPDLKNWQLLSDQIAPRPYPSSCPVMRYLPEEDRYYIISLPQLPYHRYMPYIMRTRDFEQFEMGLTNPIMFPDDEDKQVQHPEKFTPQQLDRIYNAPNCNVSDLDICEYQGKTVILYAWGNQLGKEFLAEAAYDGPVDEFLRSFFAD